MKQRPLTYYARELIVKGPPALARVDCPVLLWESGDRHPEPGAEPEVTVSEAGPLDVPKPGNPLVLPLKNEQTRSKGVSVSVGRSESNDVMVDNKSVSRLHALIHCDPRTGQWKIIDAGSRNGTTVDGQKLESEQEALLNDGVVVRLGDAQLRFFTPESFGRYVASKLKEMDPDQK